MRHNFKSEESYVREFRPKTLKGSVQVFLGSTLCRSLIVSGLSHLGVSGQDQRHNVIGQP